MLAVAPALGSALPCSHAWWFPAPAGKSTLLEAIEAGVYNKAGGEVLCGGGGGGGGLGDGSVMVPV